MIDDTITLTLPAVADFVRLARLTVASVATRVGFDYEEIEDLRIAVGEGCSLLIGSGGDGGRLILHFDASPAGLGVRIERDPSVAVAVPDGVDLSAQILDAVVDRYDFVAGEGRMTLNKSVSGP